MADDKQKVRVADIEVEEDEHPLESFAKGISDEIGEGWSGDALIPILLVSDFEGNEKHVIEGDPGDLATITIRERLVLEPGDYLMIGFRNPDLELKTDG